MSSVLLVIHLFITLALIGVVLIQRSEGGGLGIGTSQGMGSFMTGRGTANLLTRTTAILATLFMVLSLGLALLNRGTSGVGRSILDTPPVATPGAPSGLPVPPAPQKTGEAPAAGVPVTTPPTADQPKAAPATPATPAPTTRAPGAPSVPTN